MPEKRQSKRTSAVIKRRLLEQKLEKRRVDAEIRIQKARLKVIQRSEFAKEAARLRKINKNLFGEELASRNENLSPGNSSLEWDHSDETVPSFLSRHSESSDIDKIIKEILEEELDYSIELLDQEISKKRRNTSTDNNFLNTAVDENSPYFHLRWPPRLPSQEPDFNPVVHSSLTKDTEAGHSIPLMKI